MHIVLVFCFCISSITYGVEKGEPTSRLKPTATFAQIPVVNLQQILTFVTMLRSSEAVKDWGNFSSLNKNCHAIVTDTKLLKRVLKENGEYKLFKQVMQIEKIVLNLRAQNSWRLCECDKKQFNCLESSRLSIAPDDAFSKTGLFLAYGFDGPRYLCSPWAKITLPKLGGAYRDLYDFLQPLSTTFYTMLPAPAKDDDCSGYDLMRFAEEHLLCRYIERLPLNNKGIRAYRGKPILIIANVVVNELRDHAGMLSIHKVGDVDLEVPSELEPSERPRPSQVVKKHWETMQAMYAAEYSNSSRE